MKIVGCNFKNAVFLADKPQKSQKTRNFERFRVFSEFRGNCFIV